MESHIVNITVHAGIYLSTREATVAFALEA